MSLIDAIVEMADELKAWRRDVHAHPELGFEEHRTADFVAQKLESFGIPVVRGVGKTGVVGVLKEGNETRSVGLRADMDALPILEENTFAHRSTRDGCMHACGHDGHTTMLLGAAKYLAETRNFRGQVNLIFQPAEEGIGGARAMIEDGLFEQFPCDQLFAMHNAPGMPVGVFGATEGTVTAAGAFFDIDVHGTGAHGAFPHDAVDPVIIAAELVGALQTVVSRNVKPGRAAVVSVTQIHGGDAYNVIPASARLSGTVRTFSIEVMQLVERRMRELAQGVASAHGASAQLDFRTIFHRSATVWSDRIACFATCRRARARRTSHSCSSRCRAVISCSAMGTVTMRVLCTIRATISTTRRASTARASSRGWWSTCSRRNSHEKQGIDICQKYSSASARTTARFSP
jgi:amidohydrolase